ncbi:MAG: hypothetical protein LKJ75_06945 [Clostridia bacterium]|jgi:competence protein ComGC|nr:hypothetical protein [Clostridia bacterium]MCI2014921.1 hypothetical protein [Clostridia bacterium]
MKVHKKTIKNQKGETFVETLTAVVIISFATLLFTGMVMASQKINISQKNADTAFYKAMAECEAVSKTKDSDVFIKDENGIQLEKITCAVSSQYGFTSYKAEDKK